MTRQGTFIIRSLTTIAIVVLTVFLSSGVQAQTQAAAAFEAYNSAFLLQANGQTFYRDGLNSTTPNGEWEAALDIVVAEDAYQYTHAQGDRDRVIALLNSLTYYNSAGGYYGNWQTDGWDDNLAWMVNAYIRGYQMTGIASYLTEAEAGWNNGYNQGWDTTVAGGGIWENTDKGSKCGLSNNPFVFEGVQIYLATGDGNYLNKAETIYAWTRTHLTNTTNGNNNLGAPGQANGCVGSNGQLQGNSDNVYDAGAFVKAAADLYRVTGNSMYYNDALLTINHIVGEGSTLHNNNEQGNQWAYWFTRGLSDFATESNLWGNFQSWLQGNANSAWNERSNLNITWNDWTNPTSLANDSSGHPPDGNEMSSAAAIWQHLPPPSISLSGTWQLQNVSSGLSLDVTGGSKTNGAAIIQYAYGGASNQLWTFTPTAGGYYRILNANSGQAVNVTGDSGIQGAAIVQWPGGGVNGNDQWMPVQNPDGYYSFYNLNSLQTLDDPGGTLQSAQQMDQWFGNSTSAQEWKLIAH